MGTRTRRAASLGLAATLIATFGSAIVALPALASTSVTSAGSVLPGSISAGTASFTLTENAVNGFPNASGTLVVTIADSASASTVHFSGSPVVSAPASLGATGALGAGATSFVITTAASDTNNVEPITVSGLRISADAGATTGPIQAAMSGSLVGGIVSPTATATGTIQTSVGAGAAGGIVVNVGSACGFVSTGGLSSNVTFSDVMDSRTVTAATALSSGQQTLTIGAGSTTHVVGTAITQTVADCLGTNLGSPGTVGTGTPTQHLAFTTQPGGGAVGVAWAQQPVVAVESTLNAIVTSDSSTVVTLSIGTNPAGGTLSCTSGLSRTVVSGVATFSGCSVNIGSASQYTLIATSSPAWTAASSNGFLIGSSTQHLAFTTQPGGGAVGVAWAQQPVVAVENALGAIVTSDNSTVVTLSIGTNPAGGTLSCSGGLSRFVANGVATFVGCSVNMGSASLYTLNATSSPAWTAASSGGFLVTATAQPEVITDWIAAGVVRGTTGFGTSSVVVAHGGWVTLLGTTNPNLAGSIVQVWTRTRTGTWHVVTSRLVAADGTIHYFARINAWTAYQLRFGGDSAHAQAASHGRIATTRR